MVHAGGQHLSVLDGGQRVVVGDEIITIIITVGYFYGGLMAPK